MKVKKYIAFLWKELIYRGHLTALGAVSIALMTTILLKIKITWECLIIIFLASEIIYLYNRHKEIDGDFLTNPERTRYLLKHNKHIHSLIFSLFLLFLGVLVIVGRIELLLFGSLLVFLGLLYSIFLKNLTKSVFAFKNFFVSFSWATIVIFVALFYSYHHILTVIFIFIFVWITVFIQEALLDIRDRKGDKKKDLLTLSIVLNERMLFCVLSILTILASVFIFYGAYFHLLPIYSVVLFFIIPYNFILFNKSISETNDNFKYLEVLIDGEKILCGILIFCVYKL